LSFDATRVRAAVWAAGEGAIEAVRGALQGVHEVGFAGDADTLLAALAANTPAVVVLGARVGDRPSIEVIEALRRSYGPLVVPVVALAGEREDVAAALAAGANDAVARPWNATELAARIENAMALARAHAEALALAGGAGVPSGDGERVRLRGLAGGWAAAWSGAIERIEADLDAVIDAAPVGIAVVDRDLCYVRHNRAFADTWRAAQEGGSDGPRGPMDLRRAPQIEAILRRVLDTRVPQLDEEVCWPGKGGAPDRRYVASYLPVRIGERGDGVACVVVDVTERAHAERARAILARFSEGLWTTPLDSAARVHAIARLLVPDLGDVCAIYLAEEGMIRLEGAASSDPRLSQLLRARGERTPIAEAPPLAGVIREGRAEIVAEVTPALLDRLALLPHDRALLDGTRWRSAMIVPLPAQARTIGAMLFLRAGGEARHDAADLPAAEEIGRRAAISIKNARLFEDAARERRRAEDASRLKDEFLATVSHELRTPLTAILGWARMLLEARLAEDKRVRALEAIERNAQAQKRLIEDLLDVSRIISGKMGLDVLPVDLVLVVETALDSVRPAAEAKGIVVSTSFDDGCDVLGDADRLRQVVYNLLTNAVKFTPPGGMVKVSVERDAPFVRVTVADTGQGIRPEFLPHVFDRFRQADASSTRQHGGLGIGLSIAHHLVEMHGGALEVASEGEGKGARFSVRLPALAQPALVPASSVRPVAVPDGLPDLTGLRVLVVDDEPDMRGLLASTLELCHAAVEAVPDVASALSRVGDAPPDVIVSDIGMPGEDGYALLRAVRALPPERGGRVPALALTAYARAADRAAALRAGFDVHVAKPVEPAELLAAVARLSGRV
jgi:signal transduction histidine kinase/DNA-binding response OmpR family regulator